MNKYSGIFKMKIRVIYIAIICYITIGNVIFGIQNSVDNSTATNVLKVDNTLTISNDDINSYDKINIEKNGKLKIIPSEILGTASHEPTFRVKFNKPIINSGIIYLEAKPKYTNLFILNSYDGRNGKLGIISFENKHQRIYIDNSKINSRIIQIAPLNLKGEELIIDKSIKEVSDYIDKHARQDILRGDYDKEGESYFVAAVNSLLNKNDIIGKIKTTGASEIQLYMSKVPYEDNGGDKSLFYFWTSKTINDNYNVVSFDENYNVITETEASKLGSRTIFKVVYENQKPIFSQTVPAYVLIPKANMDISFESLNAIDKNSDNLWIKVLKSENREDGKERLNIRAKNKGIQVGKNFNVNSNKLGAYLTYQQSQLNFEDKYRAENGYVVADKNTGTGEVKALSLGLATTRQIYDSVDLDLIGQLTFLDNKYHSRDEFIAKNKGLGVSLSGEMRKIFVLENSRISIEPQAQLIYQGLIMKDFNDGYRKVSQGNNDLRLRLGSKIIYDNKNQKYYVKVNLWHNIINTVKAKIGKDIVEEKYAKNNIEIGLGANIPVFKIANIYADILYNKSIGKGKNYKSKITIGFDYKF